jgi:hypothetical protein
MGSIIQGTLMRQISLNGSGLANACVKFTVPPDANWYPICHCHSALQEAFVHASSSISAFFQQ